MTDRNTQRMIQPSHRIHDIIHPSQHQNKSLKPKQPLRSNTLMRTAVTKPQVLASHPISPITTTKPLASKVDLNREDRARSSSKSELVSRFKYADPNSTRLKSPVVEQPQVVAPPAYTPPEQPPQLYKPLEPATISATHQPTVSIFEKNLQNANSHNQPPVEPKERRSLASRIMTTAAISGLCLVIVGGFFAYRNFNKIGIELASTKAGFHATLPGYNPSGFDLTGISSAAGIVQTSYHSNSDSRSFTVNEKSSNYTSSELLNNYVMNTAGLNYQTVSQDGKTIYLYGSGDATWVSNGIWYIISSNNNALSDQQLIKLATTS